jgi:hypothetical protein
MTQYVVLDVADEETSVCVVDREGAVLVEAKVASEPAAIATFIHARAPHAAKVGFETGPLAAWHWHELKQLGLPVVCLDARHANAALACQINKTDRNDAFGLAQLVRMGWYREIRVKSYGSHYVRAALRVRALLVRSRCDFENQVRGLLKIFGLRLGKTGRKGFAKRMAELLEKQPELEALVGALLKVRETIVEQIATLDAGSAGICISNRQPLPVPQGIQRRRLLRADAEALPVRRDRSAGPRLEGGRRDGETLPVRGCGGVADPGGRLVAAQGVGRTAEQTDRLAAGRGRARAQARGHSTLHLGRRHRVLVEPGRGESVIGSGKAPSTDPGRVATRGAPRQGGRCPRLCRLTALTQTAARCRVPGIGSTSRRRRQEGLEPFRTSDRATFKGSAGTPLPR